MQNSWIRERPTAKQEAFLKESETLEILFGGSAGGGKSWAILAAALQFVDVPGYSALLLRRTYADLAKPGALMDRAQEWLSGTPARWSAQEHAWHFPAGGRLTFGYLDTAGDKYKYQSAEYQLIGWDELTQFREEDYRYLFSRLRKLHNARVPLRIRAATNPGGIGGDWVYRRFLVEGPEQGRLFIPSRLDDNPHINRQEYIASLMNLDPITRAQLLEGDWTVRHGGSIFRREWFRVVEQPPPRLTCVRAWDLAASEPKKGREDDPDWTAGVKMGRAEDGTFYILDVRHVRATPQAVESLIRQTAQLDGREVPILMEQEPGASGKALIAHYLRVLAGWTFHAQLPSGNKVARASPLSSQAEGGRVCLVQGPYLGALLDEFESFPVAAHDDLVDAAAMALQYLTDTLSGGEGMTAVSVPQVKQPFEMMPHGQSVGGFGATPGGFHNKRAERNPRGGGRWKLWGV